MVVLIWELELYRPHFAAALPVTTIWTKRAFTLDGNKITWATRRWITIEWAFIDRNTNRDGIGTASTSRD